MMKHSCSHQLPSKVPPTSEGRTLPPGPYRPAGRCSRTSPPPLTLARRSAGRHTGTARARFATGWAARSRSTAQHDGPITPTAAACGPDLYAGSAGIGLYLAQLYAMTRDRAFARTAHGAIDRSIRQLGGHPSSQTASPLSFHCGHLGVAFAARQGWFVDRSCRACHAGSDDR